MALELMLSVLAHSAISLENILPIDNFKNMRMHITKGSLRLSYTYESD